MEDSSSLKAFALGKLVLSSGLLQCSWSKISELHESRQDSGLEIKIYREANFTTVVFAAPLCINSSASTRLSGSENENLSPFLCSEKIFPLSVHTLDLELFDSAYNLTVLKSELLELLERKKPVIITGAALGGSVASLFTLWLLETIDPKLSRPLCITFGSPLIGDASLQQFVENSVRNSCFLHVAEVAQTRMKADLCKPFGTFLICYDSNCICIEDPEAVMELLIGVNTNLVDWRDYCEILQRLDQAVMADSRLVIDDVIGRMKERALSKNLPFDQSMLSMADSRFIPDDIVKQMVERAEKKALRFDKSKRQLNDIKISMAYMEWYKKECKEFKICYYDRFKTQTSSPNKELDIKIGYHKIKLNLYWKQVVEDAENTPQSDTSILTRRFLLSGYNYMRMFEPLDIAEYYLNGKNAYRTLGRSRHYDMLEKWFKAENIKLVRREKGDLSDLLTFDSCFWAEVEESLSLINLLKTTVGMRDDEREELTGKVVKFEEYVWGMIQEREVSPEIFLEESSFMRWWSWWKEYKEIEGFNSPSSYFTQFMDSRSYESYGESIMETTAPSVSY